MARTNSTVSAEQIFGAVENVNSTVNQGTATTVAQTRTSEASIKQHVSTTAEAIFAGQANLNSTINQGTATTVAQVRRSEQNLSAQIAKLAPRAYEKVDYFIIFISSLIAGLLGWFFCRCMISHQFAAWVDCTNVTNIERDIAGNLISTTTTTSSEVVWFTVIVTIVLFAIIGGILGWCIAGHRSTEGA